MSGRNETGLFVCSVAAARNSPRSLTKPCGSRTRISVARTPDTDSDVHQQVERPGNRSDPASVKIPTRITPIARLGSLRCKVVSATGVQGLGTLPDTHHV